ncbi:MAG: FHA domain-containing protein [Verrucomicrobiota bacterium]
MSKDTQELGASVFPFAEILQHYGQTGRTGLFSIHHEGKTAYVYLMSGIVAHAETDVLAGETAMWDILSWDKPKYEWEDSVTPAKMTMSGSVQDLILKAIQIENSGELQKIKENATHYEKTRHISEGNSIYNIVLNVSSAELPNFEFKITTKQVRVGRHPDNELVLPDSSVSRKHALLIVNQEAILVRDLGSMNGLKVDGQPITQGLAKNGQTLCIGEVNCEVMISRMDQSQTLSSIKSAA